MKCIEKERDLYLTIMNINASIFQKIYEAGKDILVKEKDKNQWNLTKVDQFSQNKENPQLLEVSFQLSCSKDQEYSIAFCYPWSYHHNQRYLSQLEESLLKVPGGKDDSVSSLSSQDRENC